MNSPAAPLAISASELAEATKSGPLPQLIDVRAKAAFESSPRMMVGAMWRNPEEIDAWLTELDIALPVVVYCVHGRQVSQGCASKLLEAGFRAAYLEGGFERWASEGHAVAAKTSDFDDVGRVGKA